MNKEKIMKVFKEEISKFAGKGNTTDLKIKLLQITENFVKTFDYELPKVFGIKNKIKKFIKRAIRKMSRFITKPYAEKMLVFQESLCELLGMYIDQYDNIYQKIEELNSRQKKLEDQWLKIKEQKSE